MDRNVLAKAKYEADVKAYQATKVAAPIVVVAPTKASAKKATPGQKRPASKSPEKIVKAVTPAKSAKRSVQKAAKPVPTPVKAEEPEPVVAAVVEAPVVEEAPVQEPEPEQ